MDLSWEQKRSIVDDGFVKIAGVVPPAMVNEALRAINNGLGQGMKITDMARFRSQSYCPELCSSSTITDLVLRTPAWDLAQSAIGPDKLRKPGSGQIAIRFPTLADPPPAPRPHLDGMYSPTNGVQQGTIQNFTLLLGVFLSAIPADFCGNFTVWPGTHRLYEPYFQEHGPESLLTGMPKVEMPPYKQLQMAPGDIALVHYQVAHAAAINTSAHVRYAVFFRLYHVEHDSQKWDCMRNIWLEWDGIRPVLAEGA